MRIYFYALISIIRIIGGQKAFYISCQKNKDFCCNIIASYLWLCQKNLATTNILSYIDERFTKIPFEVTIVLILRKRD